jgi:hypothetical protein
MDHMPTPCVIDAARRIDECRALAYEIIDADEAVTIAKRDSEFMNRGAIWFVVGILVFWAILSVYHFFAGTEMALRVELSMSAVFMFGIWYFVFGRYFADRRAHDATLRGQTLRRRWELSAHARFERKYVDLERDAITGKDRAKEILEQCYDKMMERLLSENKSKYPTNLYF